MNILITLIVNIIKMILGSNIDVKVEHEGETANTNPDTRRKLGDFLRMHYKNSDSVRPTVNPSDFSPDDKSS